MPRSGLYRFFSFAVCIAEAVADRANSLDDRLATTEHLLEHLLGVLAGGEIEPLSCFCVQLREIGVVRVWLCDIVKNQLAN